ncbi:MAG: desulfoferrodoxin family protein [Lawsonibacter sp.]|nr:desulfoferrodoxin family protein [Lawsonibacter sp.]
MKFYRCKHCGNLLTFLNASGVPVICCGEEMAELLPGSVDAALEKHVPVVETQGAAVHVKVGSVAHPMVAEHFIQWIALETNLGSQIKYLKPGQAPEASFVLAEGETLVAVYEYCNLHGLWKA